MSYDHVWLGYAGGGVSGSVIAGMSVYQVPMWHMSGDKVPMTVLILGKRLGVMAQVGAGHAVCMITGVRNRNAFTEIKSQGLDWSFSPGVSTKAALTTMGKAGKALIKLADSTIGNWAAQESAKKAVQTVMNDFSLSSSQPSFMLLPTPAAAEVGAGIFYEWQSLTKTGTDNAYKYVKPLWWLENDGSKIRLKMLNLPEQDGATIGIHFYVKRFGLDDILTFQQDRTGQVWMNQTSRLNTILGSVKGGELYDLNGTGSMFSGLNLSRYLPVGRTDIGMMSVSRNSTVATNTTISIMPCITRNAHSETNLYKWEASRYAEVRTDGEGRLVKAIDTSAKW